MSRLGHFVRICGKESVCGLYPRCYGCEGYAYTYTARDIATTKEAVNKLTKENKIMDVANARVIVGNRVYPARYVNYESSPGEYPEVEITATLNPKNSTPFVTHTKSLSITNVIFHPPATIVFWSDNTKTVVKCDYGYEDYDPEKGIAMAISKKMLGDNKYEYYNTFLHWMKKWNKQHGDKTIDDLVLDNEWNGDFANG